jgi:predicted kinase
VLADIGFLVMDVDRLAGADAAAALMAHYQEFSYEHHPPSLAHHYVAYRAMVRAKVAALRFGQGHAPSAATVREYHDLALDHLERARLRLVMVGGGSGVGKSTLARGLGAHFGYPVLATDEVRKSVTGTTAGVHRFSAPGKGIYDTVTTNRVYDEVLREAGLVLRSGRGVVLDASWSSAEHRAAVRDLATDHGVELVEVEAVLDPAIAKERIARRMADPWNPSDATPEVVDYQVSRRDPWPTAIVVSTALPPREVCANALSQIDSVRPRPLVQQ